MIRIEHKSLMPLLIRLIHRMLVILHKRDQNKLEMPKIKEIDKYKPNSNSKLWIHYITQEYLKMMNKKDFKERKKKRNRKGEKRGDSKKNGNSNNNKRS